jgi:hypothetical protein
MALTQDRKSADKKFDSTSPLSPVVLPTVEQSALMVEQEPLDIEQTPLMIEREMLDMKHLVLHLKHSRLVLKYSMLKVEHSMLMLEEALPDIEHIPLKIERDVPVRSRNEIFYSLPCFLRQELSQFIFLRCEKSDKLVVERILRRIFHEIVFYHIVDGFVYHFPGIGCRIVTCELHDLSVRIGPMDIILRRRHEVFCKDLRRHVIQ